MSIQFRISGPGAGPGSRLRPEPPHFFIAQRGGGGVSSYRFRSLARAELSKHAQRILQGVPGWGAIADISRGKEDGVNAGVAGKEAGKPRTKKWGLHGFASMPVSVELDAPASSDGKASKRTPAEAGLGARSVLAELRRG